MSELAGQIAATAGKAVVKGALGTALSGVLGILPWLPWALAGVSLVAGAGGTLWYANLYHKEQAAGKQALIDQREIDRADNAKAVGNLNRKLTDNERNYDQAMRRLQAMPKGTNAERDARIDAARDILCSKYPTSEACSGPRPSR